MRRPVELITFLEGSLKGQRACITFEDDHHIRVTPLLGDPLVSLPIQKPLNADIRREGSNLVDTIQLQVGDKVHYQPEHYGDARWENGMVKEIRLGRTDGVWVVYNCNNEWDRYRDYTGALTNLSDLKMGWK